MKWKLVAGCIVLAVVIYFLPIPVTQTKSVVVHAHYDKVLGQINNVNAWKNWWPATAGAATTVNDTSLQIHGITYTLKERQPLSIVVAQNNQRVYHVVSVLPSPADTLTTVSWKTLSYLRTAVNQMAASLFFIQPYSPKNLLQRLKSQIDDPVKYYGFVIREERVEDTIILVTNTACTKAMIPGCLRKTFATLQQQLQQAHYQGRAVPMFHVDSTGGDSVHIMAGFSISQNIIVHKPYRMMSMPRAHIVVGYYDGDYANIGRLHEAILLYMKEKKIGMVAVPYEKVLSNPQTATDSVRVKAKVYHPAMLY